ncbi:hypothetical protein [Allomuricauda sp. M10]|uniref:hypothetical protein n=1 Tax=Allomuricauda sp. M10 TaxID=2683292 RepID=UPI001D18EDF7|nr:hypothetical protein [Muricauda sp. M10]
MSQRHSWIFNKLQYLAYQFFNYNHYFQTLTMHRPNPIEIFKTNVEDESTAVRTVNALHENFKNVSANFDLEDCDRILRVESLDGNFLLHEIQQFLNNLNLKVELIMD